MNREAMGKEVCQLKEATGCGASFSQSNIEESSIFHG
jgi:hypothetical protein